MKNLPLLLAFIAALSLACRKEESREQPTPPPAPHSATPVENPPAGGPVMRADNPAGTAGGADTGKTAKTSDDGGTAAAGNTDDTTAAPPGAGAAPGRGPMRGTMVRGLQECVDGELTKRNLNEFGDPKGTAYAGGTPLFDEPTGKSTDRVEYVFKKHPDIKAACVHPAP